MTAEGDETARYRRERWLREPPITGRIGEWYYTSVDGRRWELEQRCGKGEDFGWYLFGPDGSPFGLAMDRRLGQARLNAEDYAEGVPGAREFFHAAQSDIEYQPRKETDRGHQRRTARPCGPAPCGTSPLTTDGMDALCSDCLQQIIDDKCGCTLIEGKGSMATTEPTVTKVFLGQLEGLRNSHAGNPRWRVTFADGTSYVTVADAACAYGMENVEMIGLVEVTLTRADRIRYMRRVSPMRCEHCGANLERKWGSWWSGENAHHGQGSETCPDGRTHSPVAPA